MTVLDDTKAWNTFISEHGPRSGAFLQSWEWGEFQRIVGREVRRYRTENGAAQVVSYPIRGRFFGWDLHRGPIGDPSVILSLSKDLQKTHGIFLHIEPNDRLQSTDYSLQPTQNRQPQHTLIVDLSKSEDELLAAMHEKTRYNIRLAARHGVAIEQSSPDSVGQMFDDFYRLLTETARRDKFHLHSATYYRKMIETLRTRDSAPGTRAASVSIFTARHDKSILAAALVLSFGGTTTYLHGASSDAKRNLMAPHLLHWEIIKQAKRDGCRSYDFWGIAPPDQPNHPWAGITRFKMGFSALGGSASGGGGEVITMPDAAELPLRPFWYRMYRLAQTIQNAKLIM